MKRIVLSVVFVLILTVASVSAANAQGGGQVHYVTVGETLYSISTRHGVPIEAIMRENRLINPHLIYVGQPLVIPRAYGGPMGYGAPPFAAPCVTHHTVTAGQTLTGIAYAYGVSIDDLVRSNHLRNKDIVYVGQRICVPIRMGHMPHPVPHHIFGRPPIDAYYHTVHSGETLNGIAYQYGMNYLDIVRSNNMDNASLILPGQRLYIPGYQVPPPPPAAPSYGYSEGPQYAPPSPPHTPEYDHGHSGTYAPAPPPHAPMYDDSYNDTYAPPPPPYEDHTYSDGAGHTVPAAPEYQSSPVPPILPEAKHPIEVAINGGTNWVGEAIPAFDDPAGITTLVVSTDQSFEPIVRIRSGDYEVKGELSNLFPEFGVDKPRFGFKHIPPGDYDVWLESPEGTPEGEQIPSEKVQVKVEPGKRVEVTFREGVSFSGPTFASPSGWVIGAWDNPSKPKQNLGSWSNILVRTPASGLWVKIESEGGGYSARCFTGSKGPGACDFAGLSAGLYFITIDGTDLTLKTYMDGNAYATFDFARQPTASREDRDKVGPVSYN